MKSYYWDELTPVTMDENSWRKLVAGDCLSVARTETAAGSQMRGRCYPHETFVMIVQGAWQVRVADRCVIVGANQILHIPPFLAHDIEALDHTLAMEIFPQSPAYFDRLDGGTHGEDESYLWGV